jgi:predicted  nucleic acid-binding Zn-ribbon protein
MEEPIKRLLLLQETDRKLDRVKADLEAIPRELQIHQREIEEHRLRFRGFEEAVESSRARQTVLKSEQQDLRTKVAEYRTRLLSIKTNDEYRAMLKQIDYALGKVDDMDTAMLESMEAEEEAQAELEKARRELERYEKRFEARKEMLGEKTGQLESELSALEAERETVASSIDLRFFRKYQQARQSGRPEIVVGLKSGACGGCLTNVPTQNGVEIKSGGTFLCPMCGSYVVWTEDSSLSGGR